jgi:hypothetical protein
MMRRWVIFSFSRQLIAMTVKPALLDAGFRTMRIGSGRRRKRACGWNAFRRIGRACNGHRGDERGTDANQSYRQGNHRQQPYDLKNHRADGRAENLRICLPNYG